jgi:outer membrane protein assembly factor BamB
MRSLRFAAAVLLSVAFILLPFATHQRTMLLYSATPVNSAGGMVHYPETRIINSSFLGGGERNYYGDSLPDKLDVLYRVVLGQGKTFVKKGEAAELWAGAGWTGQPLVVEEQGTPYLVIGAYDHQLKKIRMSDGKIIWQYPYDDVIKGTGTLWRDPGASCPEMEYLILQGSRLGNENTLASPVIPSYRAVSLRSGKAVWKFNCRRTDSYSRDVDGSALVVNDSVYIGLENGTFCVFDPSPENVNIHNNLAQPVISREYPLYTKQDIALHGGNLVTESSPCFLNNHIYITSGSGHIYGYDIRTKKIDWDFFTGSDIDGSPIVTSDSCILVTIEKQYIKGPGGVFKLDPRKKPADAVCWYFPTINRTFADWEGGIIGSASVNFKTKDASFPDIAAFTAIDGNTYVVLVNSKAPGKSACGPDGSTLYPMPLCVFKYRTGPSISTPILVGNRLLVAAYEGIFLFSYDRYMQFSLLDKKPFCCESTPFAYHGKVFIASRDGHLYCLGQQ